MVDGLTKKEFDLLCEKPPSYAALELEIKLLKAELKQKDEKLSELTHGIPIEKAKTGEDFIVTMKSLDGVKSYIAAYQTTGLVRHWITDDGDALYEPKILRVDHLPSQNSQTQEGSDE